MDGEAALRGAHVRREVIIVQNSHRCSGDRRRQAHHRAAANSARKALDARAAEGVEWIVDVDHSSGRQASQAEEQMQTARIVGVIVNRIVVAAREQLSKVAAKLPQPATAVVQIVQRRTECRDAIVEYGPLAAGEGDVELDLDGKGVAVLLKPLENGEEPHFGAAHAERVKDVEHAAHGARWARLRGRGSRRCTRAHERVVVRSAASCASARLSPRRTARKIRRSRGDIKAERMELATRFFSEGTAIDPGAERKERRMTVDSAMFSASASR